MAKPMEQRDWVMRVLSVEVGLGAAAPALSAPVLPIWTDAKEDLDADIEKLQQALKASGDEDLRDIAEFGLHGVTRNQSVRLVAALRDADSAKSGEAIAKAYDAAKSFLDFLAASPGVDVIEQNPLGIPVPMRAKLGAALNQIMHTLEG